jgi:hypothetical protein
MYQATRVNSLVYLLGNFSPVSTICRFRFWNRFEGVVLVVFHFIIILIATSNFGNITLSETYTRLCI